MPSRSVCIRAHTRTDRATNGGLGPTRAQETCLAVCTETRLAHHKPERTGKAIFGDRQELPQAGSSVESARRDVGALEDVVSCDARQFKRCEKCARATASMRWHRAPAWAADLMLTRHVMLLRSHEVAPATA